MPSPPNAISSLPAASPFADIEKLQIMLDEIPTTHRVFINTTLPVSKCQTEEDILAFAERNKHKITCINVSRHLQHYVVESNDSLLTRLPVPFRINCVLYNDYPKEDLIPFIERFRKLPGAQHPSFALTTLPPLPKTSTSRTRSCTI